jgi:glycosyltransferase involved in cell wall biosynthesis
MYNEALSAASSVKTIADYLSTVSFKTAIIAVNDGSKDNTGEILEHLKPFTPRLIIETHLKNGGYGAACRTGFQAAIREGFDYALVMDADGTQNPTYIGSFFEPMQASYDFIKATRYAKAGGVEGVAWKRRLISWLGNKLAKLILRLPISDYTNGFRMIKTSLLARLQTHETGFAVLLEEISKARRLGATFFEVPYTLTVRKSNESVSKFVYSWKVYKGYLKYIFGN